MSSLRTWVRPVASSRLSSIPTSVSASHHPGEIKQRAAAGLVGRQIHFAGGIKVEHFAEVQSFPHAGGVRVDFRILAGTEPVSVKTSVSASFVPVASRSSSDASSVSSRSSIPRSRSSRLISAVALASWPASAVACPRVSSSSDGNSDVGSTAPNGCSMVGVSAVASSCVGICRSLSVPLASIRRALGRYHPDRGRSRRRPLQWSLHRSSSKKKSTPSSAPSSSQDRLRPIHRRRRRRSPYRARRLLRCRLRTRDRPPWLRPPHPHPQTARGPPLSAGP